MSGGSAEAGTPVAVITGAAGGIGWELALLAVSRGMRVALCDVRPDWVEPALAELDAVDSPAVMASAVDVADPVAVADFAAEVARTFGSVHLLINNAGIERFGRMVGMPGADFDKVFDVNVRGVFNMVREFGSRMVDNQEPSRIVNVSSVGALKPGMGNGAYCAAKAAVLSMTEVLYQEFQDRAPHVAVSVVLPGAVVTSIFDDAEGEAITPDANDDLTAMRNFVHDSGITPDIAATQIFAGIDRGDFWISTNEERYQAVAGYRSALLLERGLPRTNLSNVGR